MEPLTREIAALLRAVVGDALPDIVRSALDDALPGAIRRASVPEWQSRKEAAGYIGVSESQLDVLRKRGAIGWSKRSGRVSIRTPDLDAYLEAGRVPAKSERGESAR